MLRVRARFPLGVYHAKGSEWPPHGQRMVGALLAAAHAQRDPAPGRALLQKLCEAPAPLIEAPDSVAVGEPRGEHAVVRLRGVTRWAPRNYISGGAVSPRNLGRERAEVDKAGVAVGDIPVSFVWAELDLDAHELALMSRLAADVTFLGTTRSPVVVEVDSPDEEAVADRAWMPLAPGVRAPEAVAVRIADRMSLSAFDRRHAARRSTNNRVARGGMVPAIPIGREVRYAYAPRLREIEQAVDPRWWGEMIVLGIDRGRSEVIPKAPAAYLLARAVRLALLGAFGDAGTVNEAPAILRGRDAEPHCAIVPLPHVSGPHPDGVIRGVAFVFPHPRRVADVADQRARVESGLRQLAADDQEQRFVRIPGSGKIWLAPLDPQRAGLLSLREWTYRGPSRVWVSVTPVVHSRWRKAGADGLLRQVAADCAHVDLPEPIAVESLRGAVGMVSPRRVPKEWRSLLGGPAEQLRITFPEPVAGPVLLGRARHFGLGLCRPDMDRR